MAARPQTAGTARILGKRSAREALRHSAFDQLFAEHWSAVARHGECYLDADGDVHELVAEVFHAAWERSRPEKPRGLPWLLRVADRILSDRRRRGPVRESALDAVHRNVVTSESNAGSVGHQDVRSAIARLPEPERRVVVLTYWDGLSSGEVGEVMRRRPGAVRAMLHRAREKLRISLEGGVHGGQAG